MVAASVPVVAAVAVLLLMASQASAANVTGVTFSGASQVAGVSTTYTVGFTNCTTTGCNLSGSSGSNTITVTFDAAYNVASPTITLGSGFSHCTGTGAVSGSGLNIVTVTLSNNGGTCSLLHSVSATLTISGVTNPTTAGTYSDLSVATAKATTPATGSATITAGPAAQAVITPTPSSASASGTTNISLGFQLQDSYGNNTTSSGTTSLTVSTSSAKGFFSTSNGGTGTPGAAVTVSFNNGVGTATEYYGDETAATPTITAKNGSTSWGTTTVTVTAQTSGDTMTIVQGSPQSTTVNTAFGTALEVLDQDQFGNPVPNVSVTFAAPSSGVSGTFGTCSGGNGGHTYQCIVSTNASGNATAATFTANTISGGPYNVTTSASGVASPPSFAETNTTTQTQLVLIPSTTTTTAGAADNLTIKAEDQYGNVITGYTGSHILSFTGASAIGSNTPTVTNSSGTAIAFSSTPNTAITFMNGVATVSGSSNGQMILYQAGTPRSW